MDELIVASLKRFVVYCLSLMHSIEISYSMCSRAVPNILFVFYSVRIVGRIVYSYSAE